MELKKNPRKDIHQYRTRFFLLGLCISISLVISAFEWTTEKVKIIVEPAVDPIEANAVMLLDKNIQSDVQPIQPPEKKSLPQQHAFTPTVFVSAADSDPQIKDIPYNLDPSDSIYVVSIAIVPEVEDDSTYPLAIVEKYPEPIGGMKALYQFFGTHINYPQQAKRMGVEGRVSVEFVINKSGVPIDLKILKGIGSGCDEEAIRVIGQTKWFPGKQRGIPVKVKMVLPVIFQLSN